MLIYYFLKYGFILSLPILFYYIYNRKPKSYKQTKIVDYNIKDIQRDGFSMKKIPKDLDYIIIGSGIAGLVTAAFLSKIGKKVLVLEQHYVAGGCCHTFNEHGYDFDTGIHYVGNVEKLNKILDPISLKTPKWTKLGSTNSDLSEVYDEIVVKDKSFCIRTGEENFKGDLINRFPEEEENIHTYFNLLKKVNSYKFYFILKIYNFRFNFIKHFLTRLLCKDYLYYANKTAYDVLTENITQNKALLAILLGQFGDGGCTPKKMSFTMYSGIVNHYLEGGYYPHKGPSEIIKNIIPTILKHGGRVLVRKGVKNIVLDENKKKALGVKMENGNIIYSKNVISSIGFINTFDKLLDRDVVKNLKINSLIKNYKPPISYFYSFIGLKHSLDTIGLTTRNIWGYPHCNYDKMMEDFCGDPLNAPIPYFIAFPSAKDANNESNKYKPTAVVLTMINYENFKEWEDEKCTNRSEAYKEFKQKISDRLLNECLFKHYPELKDKIEYITIGTPLTNSFYLGSPNGECLGLDHTTERFTNDLLTPYTEIDNLYMTGQDICTGGFSGAINGSFICLNHILGYGSISDILTGRELLKDINNI